ncbi:PPC domain-containing protein [Streptomyces sp. NPDC006739]|uniref:PPC domain-containing protein n=1 Tax=Streptomyces sp. NPDC006739 TaxID=3364763 RepID=UPI0036C0663B
MASPTRTRVRRGLRPETATVPEAKVGTPVSAFWTVTNWMAAVDGTLGGFLGSSRTARSTIADGETQTSTIEVPGGSTSLDIALGGASDPSADLDLAVCDTDDEVVGQSGGPTADESVSLGPAAGTYTVEVMDYSVPSGSTAYDYHDTDFPSTIASITVGGPPSVKLTTGGSTTASADGTVAAAPPEGRDIFAEVRLRSAGGATVRVGGVKIENVTP